MSDKKKAEQKKRVKFKETTKGLVILYTGEGKGKTTAALGLALRGAGYNRKVALKTLEYLKKEIISGKWDVVIADEIIGALAGNVLKFEEVRDFIKSKPERVELIINYLLQFGFKIN